MGCRQGMGRKPDQPGRVSPAGDALVPPCDVLGRAQCAPPRCRAFLTPLPGAAAPSGSQPPIPSPGQAAGPQGAQPPPPKWGQELGRDLPGDPAEEAWSGIWALAAPWDTSP